MRRWFPLAAFVGARGCRRCCRQPRGDSRTARGGPTDLVDPPWRWVDQRTQGAHLPGPDIGGASWALVSVANGAKMKVVAHTSPDSSSVAGHDISSPGGTGGAANTCPQQQRHHSIPVRYCVFLYCPCDAPMDVERRTISLEVRGPPPAMPSPAGGGRRGDRPRPLVTVGMPWSPARAWARPSRLVGSCVS